MTDTPQLTPEKVREWVDGEYFGAGSIAQSLAEDWLRLKAREDSAKTTGPNEMMIAADAVREALNRAQFAAMQSMRAASNLKAREDAVVECVVREAFALFESLGAIDMKVFPPLGSMPTDLDDAVPAHTIGDYLAGSGLRSSVAAALAKLEVE